MVAHCALAGLLIAGAGGAVIILGGWIAVIIGIGMIIAGCCRLDDRPLVRFLIFLFGLLAASGVAFVGCSFWSSGLR